MLKENEVGTVFLLSMKSQNNGVVVWARIAAAGWLGLAFAAAARGQDQQAADEVKVVEAVKTVEVSPVGASSWVLTTTNQILHPGDRLRTGPDSRAALRWSDQSVMSLGPLTELEILPHSAEEEPGLHLLEGILSFFHRDKPGRIRIITRGVTAGIDGTEFVLQESGQGEGEQTVLSLIDGKVSLTNALGKVVLTNGEQAISVPGRAPEVRRGFIANNLLQWCFYYPAVLDLNDLPVSARENDALADSFAAYRAGDIVAALERFPIKAMADSDNAQAYRAAVLLGVGNAAEAEKIMDRLEAREESSRARQLGNALRLLIAAVKRQTISNPPKPELPSEYLAFSYYAQSQSKGDESLIEALRLAKTAAERSPRFSFAWERVAELQFGFGKIDPARAALEKSLKLAPRNAQAVSLEGFLLSAQNKISAAEAQFARAISLDQALGNAWLGRGLCRIKLNRPRAGLEDLLVAAALEPQRALLRSYLGKAYANIYDDAHATKEFKLARALDPNDPTAWLYLALLKQQENQINSAISDLDNAQAENDNKSVFRSRLLLDQDRAVASANLASIYRDAGMTDVAVWEAAKAVTEDYANPSAHLFLSDSYFLLIDPTQFNLRYDTAWNNELLLANVLAPVGAGRLARAVTQQDYSKLFEADGFGFANSAGMRTDGMISESASQYGTFGNTAYSIDLADNHNNGFRVNNDLDDLGVDATIKQQLTPHDTAMFIIQEENYHSGDNFQYYYQTNARPNYDFNEDQTPILLGTWHHEWAPGIDTLLLLDRLVDHQNFADKAAPQLFLTENRTGFNAIEGVPFDVAYGDSFEIYGAELEQLCQWDRFTLLAGGRFQSGEFRTQDDYTNPGAFAQFFTPFGAFGPAPYGSNTTSLFQRATAYSYLTVRPANNLALTGGVAADSETYPYYYRNPPVISGEDNRSQVGPKAALVWTPTPEVTLRGIYTRSLGGVSIDESYRLEPTELAGFPQAFRSLISESIVGSQSAPAIETLGGAIDLKLGSRTFLEFQLERLDSEINTGVGVFEVPFNSPQAVTAALPEQFHYVERTGGVTLNQLLGEGFVFGADYKYTQSDLRQTLTTLPLSVYSGANQNLAATLQNINTYLLFNHPSGFYTKFEVHWYGQNNSGWVPVEPSVSFAQENIYAGYRFAHRRAELEAGILNLSGGGYNLNPLTVYQELPMKRVFELSFNFIF